MRFAFVMLAALATTSLATPACAAPLLFSFSGAINGSFTVDSHPNAVADNSLVRYFQTHVGNATGDFAPLNSFNGWGTDGAGQFRNAQFNTAYWNGGLDTPFDLLHGDLLFSGPTDTPEFLPGKYHLSGSGPVDLVISAAPGAPAPALATGWLAAAAAAAALAFTRVRRARPAA